MCGRGVSEMLKGGSGVTDILRSHPLKSLFPLLEIKKVSFIEVK